jgi:uncharacterized protein (DUF362 family)
MGVKATNMNLDVAEVRSTAGIADLPQTMGEMLERLHVGRLIDRSSRVALKPNLTYPFYKPGVTTSPRMLKALVSAIREYTPHIVIVESDGGSNSWTAATAFRGHEIPELCQEFDVRAVGLTQMATRMVKTEVGGKEIAIELPRLLLDQVDVFITVPVPKIHAMTKVSLGFKNQWGCIPDVKCLKHHFDFKNKVLAIHRLLRTKLAVFDGSVFLDVNGPLAGEPVRMDLLVAGSVGLATRVCCEIMEIDPATVPHLNLAIAEKLMPLALKPGDVSTDITPFQRAFRLKRSLLDWVTYGVFHNRVATKVIYNSTLASPLHKMLYALKGRPKDFLAQW